MTDKKIEEKELVSLNIRLATTERLNRITELIDEVKGISLHQKILIRGKILRFLAEELYQSYTPNTEVQKAREEKVRSIEDGVYEAIIPYGDLLLDVLEESKVGGFGKDVIRRNQENYDIFREVKTRIRSYFKTLDGHIPSTTEYLQSLDKGDK